MCEPTLILSGIGLAISAGGAVAQGIGSANAGAAANDAAKRNSLLADAAAGDALARGNKEAADYRLKAGKVVGTQRAMIGASGVDVGSGTAANISQDTKAIADLDVATIRNNAAREAWGYKTQSSNMLKEGEQALSASQWQAGGSLLTGGANVIGGAADAYRSYKKYKGAV
jgi:hypothetical protein